MSKASADKSSAKGKEVPPTNSCMKQPEALPEDEEDLVQIINHPTEHDYFIELPEEGEDRIGDNKTQRLDLASESELIQTWNHRLNLKRSRVPGISLDDVEEELVKRKKMKKESWYDDEGKLVCVSVSTVLVTQTFVVDEDGGLRPNTP